MKKVDKDKYEKTYGLFKFKVPTKQEQISAISLTGESTLFKKMVMNEYEKFYDAIPTPDIGDWLMTHKEHGQTHEDYIRSGVIPVLPNKDTIYLAALSFRQNEQLDKGFVTSLLLMTQAYFYGMKVKLMEITIDLKGVECRNFDDNRVQINANHILEKLIYHLPNDAYCLIAYTDTDLYNDNRIIKARDYTYKPNDDGLAYLNNYCYGLSSIRNRVGIISFARYDPLFYAADPKLNNKEKLMKVFFILLKRACKVLMKEITHMFGLKNCIYFHCNMNGFNSMEEFDRRPIELCPVCIRKLMTNISNRSNLEGDRVRNPLIVFDRFVKIRDNLHDNFYGIFNNEVNWYNARIESLKTVI